MKKRWIWLLVCLVLLFVSAAAAETSPNGADALLFRLSSRAVEANEASSSGKSGSLKPDLDTWKKELTNLRIVKRGRYTFKRIGSRYGIDHLVPNEKGLGSLYISGSEEFNRSQFKKLAKTLRKEAGKREIWVIDLRRESHVIMGDVAVCWEVGRNAGNPGLSAKEIEADEKTRFTPYVGKKLKIKNTTKKLGKVYTERELVEAAGFQYYRLPLQDHVWPKASEIDRFIRFVKGLDQNKVWLHFHCRLGKGRTATMMVLYDKMKNPDVPIEEIAVRQARLGGSYLLYTDDNPENWKSKLYAKKARMTLLLGQYVEENWRSGYQVSWSSWLKKNDP